MLFPKFQPNQKKNFPIRRQGYVVFLEMQKEIKKIYQKELFLTFPDFANETPTAILTA